MEPKSILKVSQLNKSFPGVKALSQVQLELREGEIMALLGGNGAGKSTLIKCITGVYTSDGGSISLSGQSIRGLSAEEIILKGISTVHQEVNLIPTLSVAENIYLGRQPYRFGLIDWAKMNTNAEELLSSMKVFIDVTATLNDYSIAVQQMIAIARGVDMSAKVLILDEPTASLDNKEVEQLFTLMRELKSRGIGIVFVTHFLDQVYDVCDQITVLRNGQFVASSSVDELPQIELINLMLGKQISNKNSSGKSRHTTDSNSKPFLSASNIGRKGMINPCDVNIYSGQTLGLGGLLGSGRTELAKLLFGIVKPEQGTIQIEGEVKAFGSPHDAIQEGLAFCPEDRKVEGIIGELSVLENMVLALQAKQGWFRMIGPKEQKEIGKKFVRSLNIVTSDINKPVKELSGGNQQKVILARWLASGPSLLILDEPTRGIDVGAKSEILQIIDGLCKQGMALMVISSELDEIVEFSDRVSVLKDHNMIAELTGKDISTQKLMETIAHEGRD
ncbi:sugar ABC transporter ATP-binding protein [Alginatibacterium sediminis]|uniref:Sugar ABC transporter ATP-binding protein n=1 Tax=Alginatibacterium sediminis TaxID=2164068 RepID=A0A420E9X9_9ALTE|nr:sugar ABC transporter ATP-binding protein [Alginatibacterium sediminis]RKF17479.1 sugar ABC transporter ATP-binding protein [Alginatibacterium sediminis]